MEVTRRTFLKLGGLSLLGLLAAPALDILARADLTRVLGNPEAVAAKRWALAVDMRKCWENGKGTCQDCLLACRQAHNVPDIPDPQEEIKWIWTEPYENAFPGQEHPFARDLAGRPFLVLCNHCADPPCVRVCPTRATFKREDGIIMMDYHRCLGCRYCLAACPYGARSFNFRDPRPFIRNLNPAYPTRERGVVEKCNFCEERLAAGLAPACVAACRYGALVCGDLEDPRSPVREILRTRYTIRRKPELGTRPNVYYVV